MTWVEWVKQNRSPIFWSLASLLTVVAFCFSLYAWIDFDDACPIPAAAGEKSTTAMTTTLAVAAREDLAYPHIVYTSTAESETKSRILSLSPLDGNPTPGIRSYPIASIAGGISWSDFPQDITRLPGTNKIVRGYHVSNSFGISQFFEGPTEEGEYRYTVGTSSSTTSLTGINMITLPSTGTTSQGVVMLVFTGTTTAAIFGQEEGKSFRQIGNWTTTTTLSSTRTSSFIRIKADPTDVWDGYAAVTCNASTTLQVLAFNTHPASVFLSDSNLLTLTTTSGVLNMALFPSETDLSWHMVALLADGTVRRWRMSWSGTASTSIIIDEDMPAMSLPFGVAAHGSAPSKKMIMTGDNVVILAAGTVTGGTRFVGIPMDPAVTTPISLDSDPYEDVDIQFIGQDESKDRMILSWVERQNVFKIASCQWNPTTQQLVVMDSYVTYSLGCAQAGELIDSTTGHYIVITKEGTIIPIWVSPTRGTISFNDSVGRFPVGYVDQLGVTYAPETVVALPEDERASFSEGNTLYADEDGVLTLESGFASRLPMGTFLGDPDLFMFSPILGEGDD